MLHATSQEKSHRLSKSPSKPNFRFHKNLATSRYEEFLAESDDEEFFKSKPVTKDGRNYELDFKIDTYRDQIKLHKNGSQTKLISARPSVSNSVTGFITVQDNSRLPTETEFINALADTSTQAYNGNHPGVNTAETSVQVFDPYALNEAGEPTGASMDMLAANNYLHSLGGMASVDLYKKTEDIGQIPMHELMGEVNKTVLRCAEATFRIDPS